MRRTGPDEKTRAIVWQRDLGNCAACGCYLAGWFDVHHRRPRGMGGSRRPDTNSPANLMLLCTEHHERTERDRRESRDRGLLVRQGVDPSTVPVQTWRGLIYLDHEGGWSYADVEGVPA